MTENKLYFIVFLFFIFAVFSNKTSYDNYMQKGDKLVSLKKYCSASKYFKLASNMPTADKDLVQYKITSSSEKCSLKRKKN